MEEKLISKRAASGLSSMSDWPERRRLPFDFEVRISGLFGGEPFSFRITPEGIETRGLTGLRRTARPTMAKEREPLVEVIEEKEYVVVTAEMPGVPKEAIKVKATETSLTISAESEGRSYYKEVSLPAKVDPKASKATYNNGILEVRLRKVEGRGEDISVE